MKFYQERPDMGKFAVVKNFSTGSIQPGLIESPCLRCPERKRQGWNANLCRLSCHNPIINPPREPIAPMREDTSNRGRKKEKPLQKVCEACGKTYYRRPTEAHEKWEKRCVCSISCARIRLKRKNRERNLKIYERSKTKTFRSIGKEFGLSHETVKRIVWRVRREIGK